MSDNIVQINVSVTQAPAPLLLQRTGAFISQGATTLAAGVRSLLTEDSDLTPILVTPKAIVAIAWNSGTATVTMAAPHGIANATVFQATIAGVTPVGYNGTFTATVTGASTFTYPLVANPGAVTIQGTMVPASAAELFAMVQTFFAQGSGLSCYVLELGLGTPANGVTALTAWITANPKTIYSYLVPRAWSGEATFVTYAATFEGNTAQTYFWVTSTTGNYASFTGNKAVVQMIEAPGIPATEFSLASAFWRSLNYNPSPANKVTPFAFGFLIGVTVYPITPPQTVSFKAGNLNYVTTAAEGGLSNTMLKWGVTGDGRDFTYWYSVDWVALNMQRNLANEIINGSNNPQAPLYYEQAGINRLQNRARKTGSSAIANGLALGNAVATQLTAEQFVAAYNAGDFAGTFEVNAIPFTPYTSANPGDYPLGIYNGLAAVYTPSRGFTQIIFNINVTDFVAA
jgi:hypothetical protein